MIKLYCETCALVGGSVRLHDHAIVATFELEDVHLPLDGSMFKGMMPDRDIPGPWARGASWDVMRCPRNPAHLVWTIPIESETVQRFQKQGGPDYLITSRGKLRLDGNGVKEHPDDYVSPPSYTEEDLDAAWADRQARKSIDALVGKEYQPEDEADRVEIMATLREKAGLSYAKIGEKFGLSGERVRQLLVRRQKQLRGST